MSTPALPVPFPLFHTPPGLARPTCCPHVGPQGLVAGAGPSRLGGNMWGGPYHENQAGWVRSPAGWWVQLAGHQPQHLRRLAGHPRLPRWTAVAGAQPGQAWAVPVVASELVLPTAGDVEPARTWVMAVDRELGPEGWRVPADLREIAEALIAITEGIPLADTPEARDQAVVELAIRLAALGHWVDRDLLALTGWMTEDLARRMILAALGRPA